jgi:hypothetical protein
MILSTCPFARVYSESGQSQHGRATLFGAIGAQAEHGKQFAAHARGGTGAGAGSRPEMSVSTVSWPVSAQTRTMSPSRR